MSSYQPLFVNRLRNQLDEAHRERNGYKAELARLQSQLSAVTRERDEAVTTIRLLDADLSVIRKKLDEVRAPSDPERHTTPLIIRIERLAAERDEYESRWKEAVLEADNAYDDVRVELAELWNDALSGTPKPVRIIEPLESHYRLTLELRAELAKLRDGWISVEYLECQIAADLEAALCDGKLAPDQYVSENRKTLHDLIEKAVSKASAGWISVTERLPEPEQFKLWCYVPVDEPPDVKSMCCEDFILENYTHYRDLPAPPTDGRAE